MSSTSCDPAQLAAAVRSLKMKFLPTRVARHVRALRQKNVRALRAVSQCSFVVRDSNIVQSSGPAPGLSAGHDLRLKPRPRRRHEVLLKTCSSEGRRRFEPEMNADIVDDKKHNEHEDEADAVLWRMLCLLSTKGRAPWHEPRGNMAAFNKACLQSRQARGPKESERSASVSKSRPRPALVEPRPTKPSGRPR